MDEAAQTRQVIPHMVTATYDADGRPVLATDGHDVAVMGMDLTGVVSLWESPSEPVISQDVGNYPEGVSFALAGNVKLGKSWIAPSSEGELDFAGWGSETFHVGDDSAFHSTDTLDFGVVTSGEAELSLEDGQTATVSPGTAFILTGVQHRWHVTSDEPFVFWVFTVGASRAA